MVVLVWLWFVLGDICKVRWKALRDPFVRNRKKQIRQADQQVALKSTGSMQRKMSFPLPHLQARRSVLNYLNICNCHSIVEVFSNVVTVLVTMAALQFFMVYRKGGERS